MADRGQIKGAIVDGPLAFDNAISPHAAQVKQIISPVAGDADILVAPDLESANMLAKQLEYMAGASGAGVVINGHRCFHVLQERSDVAAEVDAQRTAATKRENAARVMLNEV